MRYKWRGILLLSGLLFQCGTLFKSSVSIVYIASGAVLLSSASVSGSIDSLSRSVLKSSQYVIPPEGKEEGEYGIEPEKGSPSNEKPKQEEDWNSVERVFVKDAIVVSRFYLQSDSNMQESLSRDLQLLGEKNSHLVSDYYGLSLVAVGMALKELGIDSIQFNEILSYLKDTNQYGKNSLIYGYNLSRI